MRTSSFEIQMIPITRTSTRKVAMTRTIPISSTSSLVGRYGVSMSMNTIWLCLPLNQSPLEHNHHSDSFFSSVLRILSQLVVDVLFFRAWDFRFGASSHAHRRPHLTRVPQETHLSTDVSQKRRRWARMERNGALLYLVNHFTIVKYTELWSVFAS